MKAVLKILAALVLFGIIGIVALIALVGAGASAVSDAQTKDTASSHAFAQRFTHVHVGDALSGSGGMTRRQVRAILGRPTADNITRTQSGGIILVTWSYPFTLANGTSLYDVEFTNGHVSGKSRI
jgi:hypothetical protein